MVLAEFDVGANPAPVVARPLTPERFAQYGGVLSFKEQAGAAQSSSANYGTAIKLFKVSPVVNDFHKAPSGQKATANLNIFHCTPPNHLISASGPTHTYLSKVLERHPHSTQTFMPMGRPRSEIAYMVIVAKTRPHDGMPDLDTLEAFLCRGDQAVTYGAGTWHAPMIALNDEVSFAVLIHENGVADEDCQEVYIKPGVPVEFNPETVHKVSKL